MNIIISSLVTAAVICAKKEVWTLSSPDHERLQFQDETLIEKIPFPGSITTYLEGNLLSTGQLHCAFAVFRNYTEWKNRLEKIKCKGLQIMGLSTKYYVDYWKLTTNKKDDATHAKIVLERLKTETIPQLEYLITACCLYQENVKSYNLAILRLVALPVFHYPFDLQNATNKKRNYAHPHLIEIGPCPCDVTKNNCDTFCCCDPDCPAAFINIFHCLSGWYGGQRIESFENESCSNTGKELGHDDSVMCIYIANSAFLGHFYHDVPKIKDEASFPSIASDTTHMKEILIKSHINKHEKAKHSNIHPRHLRQNATKPIYHYGEKLQVISNYTGVPKSAEWYLPVSLYDGSCTLTYPLHFLINLHSLCDVQLEKICKQGTPSNTLIDSKSFVTEALVLLEAPGSPISVQTHVTYLCAKDVAMYIKYDSLNTSAFPEVIPCVQPVQPLSPRYQDGICYDVVLEVKYNLLWKNGNILLRNTTIILGNVSVISRVNKFWNNFSVPLLTQHFSVEFNYLMNITNSSVAITSALEKLIEPETRIKLRSGNPGYEIGFPVISAIKGYTNSTIVAAVGNHLNLWNADTTGRCELAGRRPVLFGINSISGCSIEIKPSQLNETCFNLKSNLLDVLDSLIPAEYLSKGGDPDIQEFNDFIPLFHEKLELWNPPSNETEYPFPICRDLPHHIHLEIGYAEIGRNNYTSIMKIVGAVVKYRTLPRTPQCSPYSNGCESIRFPLTSSVHFIPVSLVKQRIKRYWDIGEIKYCNREICWEEMFYPFTDAFTADAVYEVFFWSSTIILAAPLIGIIFNVV